MSPPLKSHCAQGHPYTDETSRPRSDRGRLCVICKRDTARRREERKKRERTGSYGLCADDFASVNARRFWSKVAKGDGCWIWGGRLDASGYGTCFIPLQRTYTSAHRVAWVLAGRALDSSLSLDHLCRVRNCVNPNHLELVPIAENVRRAWASRAKEGAR